MIGTIVRRITVRTLDAVVERGQASAHGPVRALAGVFDRAREVVGLKGVAPRIDLPTWETRPADEPLWDSSRKRLDKWRQQMGYRTFGDIAVDHDTTAPDKAPITVYLTRGCPYARAAQDLLREREIEFLAVDIKGDEATRSWVKIRTGSSTLPQIFVHERPIGGYDQLRELDQSGELKTLLERGPVTDDEDDAEDEHAAAKEQGNGARKRLPVIHPEASPFEKLGDGDWKGDAAEDGQRFEGDALVAMVERVLDECRPMVRADGGDIKLLDVQEDVVHVELTGNCIGCPSSQATLRQGIERRLRSRIPQIKAIASPQLRPLH